MENFKVIEFHESRDFSKKLNVTFEFIRQNYAGLGKSILFIAGPPAMIAGIILSSLFKDIADLSNTITPASMELFQERWGTLSYWMEMVLMMVFGVVSMVMIIATINNYLILYGDKRTNRIEVDEVWERVRATFWMYCRTVFSFWLLALVVYIVLVAIIVLLTAISPYLIFPGFLLILAGFCYFSVAVSLTFIIRAYEKIGFIASFTRSFKLIQGKWWSTFGLIFALSFVMVTICNVFVVPLYVIMTTAALHNTWDTVAEPSVLWETVTIVFSTLFLLGLVVFSALPILGTAFQYFNLVEQKEARGLMASIESFGEREEPLSSDDQF